MSSISSITAIKAIKNANLRLITLQTVASLFDLQNENTLYKIILRLEKYGLIERIAKGKYVLNDNNITDFEKANLIMSPSYISLESALNYYGILPQFPYSITSVTLQKSNKLVSSSKEFEYTHLSPRIYWGFLKKEYFLIASPEKALIDLIYLVSKGIRKTNFEEFDYSNIDKDRFKEYAEIITFSPFQKYIKRIQNIW